MTPEAQRIAIAEACGAKWRLSGDKQHQGLSFDEHWSGNEYLKDAKVLGYDIPKYLTDLNAMHEAEKVIFRPSIRHGDKWDSYSHILRDLSDSIIHATAAQRAEAFLRTIGKWEES